MDQNRCLLDVIDNPQLLQSFLESESSAETSNNNSRDNIQLQQATSNPISAHNVTSYDTVESSSNAAASSSNDQNATEPTLSISTTSFADSSPRLDSSTLSSSRIDSINDNVACATSGEAAQLSGYGQSNEAHYVGLQNDPNDQSSIIDPVGSVLDSIITDTVAETSPSTQVNIDNATDNINQTSVEHDGATPDINGPHVAQYPATSKIDAFCPSRTDIQISSPALDATPTYHNVGIDNESNINDANNNNNSTSSSDNGSNDLLVDEYYSQHLQQNVGSAHGQFQHEQPMGQMDTSDDPNTALVANPPDDTRTTAFNDEESMSKSQSQQIVHEHNQIFQQESSIQDPEQYHPPPVDLQSQSQIQLSQQSQPLNEQKETCVQPTLDSHQPQTPQSIQHQSIQPQLLQQQPQQQDSNELMPSQIQQQPPAQSQSSTDNKTSSTATSKSPKTSKANNKNSTSSVAKAPDSKPKRAPRPKKPAKTSNTTTTPTQTQATTTNTPVKPMQTQYIATAPGQHQVIFQNNNGIRQPTMLAPTSLAQPIGAMQPQRVIQIQTANGPMYFAIAPGPATNANNNNVVMNQQQQQTGMQSHQYPSQQICYQSNNNVIMNRPQMTPTMSQPSRHQVPSQQQQQQPQQSQMTHQQMQQHHQQMQSPQPVQQQQNQSSGNIVVSGHQMMQSPQRIAAPIMAGQTIAIANQQNSHQQQHVILPSSQPMMMPRMSNQIIMNRPMSTTGQLMPGQQQYIQVLTPNGPMLLALPQQQAQQQTINNTMIDYNAQNQMSRQIQQHPNMQQKPVDMLDGAVQMTPTKQSGANSTKSVSTSKSGLDLADLLLDCGILPEDRAASQSSSSIKSSQSPSLSQMSSPMPPNLPQTNSPMPTVDSTSFHPNQQQHTPQPMSGYGQYQGQPIRITMGPDGQMIMQPAVYGAIRPMLAGGVAQPTHLNTFPSNNMISSSSPMMAMTSSNPTTPKPTAESPALDNSKKTPAKAKTAVKRSRSKKSDVDKFPQLKTPKIAQQQQQQQQQQPQQPQAVAVVPMTFLVGDQSKVLASGPDVKPNVTQLAGGQQVSLAKFVSPVMPSTQVQSSIGSNVMQTSVTQHTNSLTANQVINSGQMNTQLITSSGNSINISNMQQQQNSNSSMMTTSTSTSTNTSTQMSSSGNVTINLIKSDSKTGTVESNPHISSSLMPTISLTVDNLKIEQNGLKTSAGQISNQNFKGPIIHNVGGLTTTLVLHPAQAQQRHSINIPSQAQLQQQQMTRKKEMRNQAILNQLKADQNAALNPQTKQPFKSLEDACKRLLRYHVFDTETVSETKIREVDEIFEAAVESLLKRKQAIYDKFRYLILKHSMKNVPMSEEVMLDQVFVNDELAYLKKERELFREYEAHLESIALDQTRDDTKSKPQNDCGQNYFAFGSNSPKQKDQVDQDNVAHSRDVDDWLLPDKWSESRYQSVPDSEAATAIESILNEEIS